MQLPTDFWEQFDKRIHETLKETLNATLKETLKTTLKEILDKRFESKRMDAHFDKRTTKISTMEQNLDKLVNWTKGIDYDDPINLLNSKI